MKIAVIGAEKGTVQVKKILLEFLDNITVECFTDTSEYVHIVSARNWKIDRIIILQDGLPKADTRNSLIRFNQFVDECNLRTNIILIVKDLNIASNLSDIFVSMYHCIFQTITIKPTQIKQIGSLPIEELRDKYGYKLKEINAEVSEIEVVGNKEEKPKKKGLLSGLFGKKKQQDKPKQEIKDSKAEDIENIQKLPSLEEETDENFGVPVFDDSIERTTIDTMVEANRKSAMEFHNVELDKGTTETTTPTLNEQPFEQELNQPIKQVPKSELIQQTQEPLIEPKPFTPEQDKKQVTDELINVFDLEQNEELNIHETTTSKYESTTPLNKQETEDFFNKLTSTENTEELIIPKTADILNIEKENNEVVEDELLKPIVFDDDHKEEFTDSDIKTKINELVTKVEGVEIGTGYIEEENIHVPKLAELEPFSKGKIIEEVQETTVDMNISRLEAELRSQEQIQVQNQEIHEDQTVARRKPIVGYGGRRNFIFTGDRGTGITSTALTVASMLARKEPTLFVDFDIDYNGFIYYATIDNILEEDDYIQSGLVHLNRFDNIKAVTYTYHKGGFDVLLSFFDSGVTEDDIRRVQKILTLQKTYKNVVIDCPLDKLHLLRDLIEQSTILLCTRVKLKTLITTLQALSNIEGDSLKYNLYKNSRYLITDGQHPEYLLRNLLYIKDLFTLEEEEIDWTDMPLAGSTTNMMALLKELIE